MDRLIREVPNAARRGVEPLLLFDIVSQRKGLQTPPVQRCEKVVDILPPQHVFDLVLLAIRWTFSLLLNITGAAADLGPVCKAIDRDLSGVRRKLCACKVRSVRLHGEAVEGCGPELVEILVAFPAAHRARKIPGPGWSFAPRRERNGNPRYQGYSPKKGIPCDLYFEAHFLFTLFLLKTIPCLNET